MQAGAVATKGVLDDACAAGYRERSGMADGGARVPEVFCDIPGGMDNSTFSFLSLIFHCYEQRE